MRCKHCKDNAGFMCNICGKILDQCAECHAELSHNIIENQNVATCTNRPCKQDSEDEDAYRVSTQTNFR